MSNKILVISASLNPNSRSRMMADEVFQQLPAGADKEFLDLRDYDLPICDAGACYSNPLVSKVQAKVKEADCILVAFPVYNYSCSAALKNLIELTGKAWENKIVGFVCAAGGHSSYMSVMGIANSLMLDFRCLVIPRFVYSEGSSFSESGILSDKVKDRLKELGDTGIQMMKALLPTPVI
jgi:NAD(P)H-dependent FMN reductase